MPMTASSPSVVAPVSDLPERPDAEFQEYNANFHMPYLPRRNGGNLNRDCQELTKIASRLCSESIARRPEDRLEIAEAGFVRDSTSRAAKPLRKTKK
jgi:hypothetical protein